MKGDEGEIVCLLKCFSYFVAAYTFSGEIILVYVHIKKNPIATYSIPHIFSLNCCVATYKVYNPWCKGEEIGFNQSTIRGGGVRPPRIEIVGGFWMMYT